MNLRQIEVFRAVMLAGSVTDAARQLHVSQPGVSRMLGHIELQLGIRLFERKKGKLISTPEAQALYAEVEQVYSGVQRIDNYAHALKSGKHLSLRILISPSTGQEMAPRAVSRLADLFPDARIHMEVVPARDMVTQLLNREADIAISTLRIEHTLLTSKTLGKWTLACVFPAGHALGKQRAVNLRDILKERIIAFSPDTPQGRIITDWCEKNQFEPRTSIEVRAGQAACALAACGAGVAIVDDLTARSYRTDKLDFRPIAQSPSFGIYAVTNDHFILSIPGKKFVELAALALKELRRNEST